MRHRLLNPLARHKIRLQAPSLMSILLRTQEIYGVQSVRTMQSLLDLLIEPDVAHIRIDNFDAYQAVHDLGYAAATQALSTWERSRYGI